MSDFAKTICGRSKIMKIYSKWCRNGVVAIEKPHKIRGYEAL